MDDAADGLLTVMLRRLWCAKLAETRGGPSCPVVSSEASVGVVGIWNTLLRLLLDRPSRAIGFAVVIAFVGFDVMDFDRASVRGRKTTQRLRNVAMNVRLEVKTRKPAIAMIVASSGAFWTRIPEIIVVTHATNEKISSSFRFLSMCGCTHA